MIQLTLTLKMTTAQVVETSVTVNNNSPIQDYVHPDDQTQPTFEMTPGFKPFTVLYRKSQPVIPGDQWILQRAEEFNLHNLNIFDRWRLCRKANKDLYKNDIFCSKRAKKGYFLKTTLKLPGVGFLVAGVVRVKFGFYHLTPSIQSQLVMKII